MRQERKQEESLFPEDSYLRFDIEGVPFRYKCEEGYRELDTVLLEEEGNQRGLYVYIYQRLGTVAEHSYLDVELTYYEDVAVPARSSYSVKLLRELPPEVSNLVKRLAAACWESSRKKKEAILAKKQQVLSKINGADGMLSSDPLVRWIAQEGWKKDKENK
jgi:hypothetical protein